METRWEPGRLHRAMRRGLTDPHLEWARCTGFSHLHPLLQRGANEVSLLFELDIPAADWARNVARHDRWKTGLRIPTIYANPARGLAESCYCTGLVRREFIPHLCDDGDGNTRDALRQQIKRIQFGLPVGCPPEAQSASPTFENLKPFDVVTGIIDDVLAVAHWRFRRLDGSARVEYFWDQDAPPERPTVPYGREYDGDQITSKMKEHAQDGIVDEDAVYRDLQINDYRTSDHKGLGRRAAHGTHVMDLACGFDPLREPQADGRPIIGVQLPVRSVRDTSGAFLWPQVYDGLRYVVDRADRLARAMRRDPPPVVVNLSYGAIAGPHDGSSPLERAIDELIGLRTDRAHAPLQVVLPAGNHHLSRCHARIDVPTEEPAELRWRILPDCRTPSILEIWLPKPRESERREVAVQVVPPTGDASPPLKEGDHYVWDRGGVLCQATYDPQPAGGDRPLIQVVVEATATLDASKAVAPCGLWRVQIEYSGPDAVIDAWIQRNDTPFGWPILGRQSYFDDPNYVRFDANGRERQRDDDTSYVKRAGSLNSIATGERPVVIGGARRSDGTVAIYSGAGPTMGPTSGPDAIAASDQSPARYGVIAAGTRSGAVFRMTGTSVAAPQVTRLIAEELSERRPGDRAAVQKWAGAYTIRKSSSPPPLDPRSGAGLISTPTAPPGAKRE